MAQAPKRRVSIRESNIAQFCIDESVQMMAQMEERRDRNYKCFTVEL